MTGIAFIHILKAKEIEFAKNMQRTKGRGKPKQNGDSAGAAGASGNEQQNLNPNQVKNSPVDVYNGRYAKSHINKMMMDHYGSGRYYHLNPELHLKENVEVNERQEFPTSIYVKFKEGKIEKLEAGEISKMFDDYGDFYLFKDTLNSVFIEFFYIDPKLVVDRKPNTLIELLN